MSEYKYSSPFNSLTSIIILVLFFIALFYIARAAFWILGMLAPILIIATLVIDHTVITNYGKWLLQQLKSNPLVGVGAILLTIFGMPVVAGFLFAKALLKRKVKELRKDMQKRADGDSITGEFINYEEVELDDTPPVRLELPDIKKRPTPVKEKRNEYDDLFE